KVDEAHEHVKTNWQLEKAQRIKPSLWWQQVAQAQTQNQTTSTEQSNANTPKLSNLSTDGRAWFIHPVAMVDYFQEETKLWYEPLENPQRTLYNSSRNIKPSNGAFGYVRAFWNEELKRLQKKTHNGLDLFADINTPCYACLDGKIVQYKDEGNKGYGNVLAIEVKGDDLRASRNDYTLEFEDEVVNGNGFNLNVDHFYLRYCHLSDKRADLEVGDKVKAGDLIGYTGDTGNAKGVCNPHLHFEIAMKISGNGIGLINRYNPAFFVNLQKIDENLQTNVKERRFKEKK
ncbi:M23 family metallopeptidase, partial [Gilliamella sp. Pas-s27]|uniref:M23 family metallopeptidase n=1 Tax=Gilliamella sp. Pas-s27 TaxID=2687311 RepID=UPI001365ECC3